MKKSFFGGFITGCLVAIAIIFLMGAVNYGQSERYQLIVSRAERPWIIDTQKGIAKCYDWAWGKEVKAITILDFKSGQLKK